MVIKFEFFPTIETDTELFVHYGFQYWLKQFMLRSKKPELRFFYYSLHDQSTQIFNLQKFYEYDDPTCIGESLSRVGLFSQTTPCILSQIGIWQFSNYSWQIWVRRISILFESK